MVKILQWLHEKIEMKIKSDCLLMPCIVSIVWKLKNNNLTYFCVLGCMLKYVVKGHLK